VKDVDDRKGILSEQKRCYLCLQVGRCAHEYAHEFVVDAMANTINLFALKLSQHCERTILKKNKNQKRKRRKKKLRTTTTSYSSSKVFLQTATIYAYSPHGNSAIIPVRVLFDSGSQRSYTTNHLKKRLGIQPVKKETLNLNTFGQEKFTKPKFDVVSLSLQKEGKNIA
jgi:hypothetical protein